MEITKKHSQNIADLRNRLTNEIPPTYDTNFNLLRWIINAEKLSGMKTNLDMAEKQLRHHLRYRKSMRLDEPGIVPPVEQNPLYKDRLLPQGSMTLMKSNNKFLWNTEYKTLDMVGLTKSSSTSDILLWHFWLYDAFLKKVNEQEAATNRMSGLAAIIDTQDYTFNPATALLFHNGQMTYYVTVIHYEHYPQLAYPIYAINVPRWLYLCYKMIKMVLPKDVNDRIRMLDSNFKQTMRQDFDAAELPECLGGTLPDAPNCRTIEARRWTADEYYQPQDDDPPLHECLHLQINARRRKFLAFECHRPSVALRFHFRSDADIVFGVFFDKTPHGQPHAAHANSKAAGVFKQQQHVEVDTDDLLMVNPLFCLQAKFVPEKGVVFCEWSGTYFFVFWNKNSWISRRNVYLKLELQDENSLISQEPCQNVKNVVTRTFSTN